MSKKIIVDQETCIGCALCTTICPNVFTMESNGKAQAINQEGDTDKNKQNAIDACPVSAIHLDNEN